MRIFKTIQILVMLRLSRLVLAVTKNVEQVRISNFKIDGTRLEQDLGEVMEGISQITMVEDAEQNKYQVSFLTGSPFTPPTPQSYHQMVYDINIETNTTTFVKKILITDVVEWNPFGGNYMLGAKSKISVLDTVDPSSGLDTWTTPGFSSGSLLGYATRRILNTNFFIIGGNSIEVSSASDYSLMYKISYDEKNQYESLDMTSELFYYYNFDLTHRASMVIVDSVTSVAPYKVIHVMLDHTRDFDLANYSPITSLAPDLGYGIGPNEFDYLFSKNLD